MGILGTLVKGLTTAAKAASSNKKVQEAYKTAVNNKSNNSSGYTPTGSHFDETAKKTNSSVYDAIAEQGRLYNEAKAAGDTAGMEKAHKAAEAYRASLGYSGGEDGSEYIPTTQNTVQVPTYVAEEDDYYKWEDIQARYDKLNDDIAKKQEQAVKQGTARLEAQKTTTNQGYDDAARQAYIAHMKNKKALPQQLASSGLTGGETETSNIMLNSNYENNINDIAIQRQNAINELDNAIVDLKNSGDLSTAEQVLANNQQALNAYQNYLNNKTSYNQWATTHNANRYDTSVEQTRNNKIYQDNKTQQDWQNQRYDEEVERQKKEAEINRIRELYENGQITKAYAAAQLGIPEENLYDTFGYTTKVNDLELKAAQADINKVNRTNTGGSGGGNGGSTSPSTINSITNNAIKMMTDGYFNDAVRGYILSQNITEQEQYNILSNLGLI